MSLRRAALVGLVLAVASPVGASAKDRGGGDGRDSRGKCENAQACDDRDFSPTFRDSPVDISGNTICVMPGSCSSPEAGRAQRQSLLPPSPAKMVAAMNAMAKGIGEAAGALAGAIGGGIGGIFFS
jgi:hypothetical protein